MLIHEQLRQLRKEHKLTLSQLSEKVGYGTGNLSSYETGKLKPKDTTLLRILTLGYELSTEKAANTIAQWRKEDLEEQYQETIIPKLAQKAEEYNKNSQKKTLSEFLKDEGLSKTEIEKIQKEIELYKKKSGK